MSIAGDAYDEMIERLEAIEGLTVFHGIRPAVDGDGGEMPAVCVYEGEQESIIGESAFCDYLLRQSYVLECYIADDTAPADTLRDLLESVQQAVESSTTLGGATLTFAGIPAREMPQAGGRIARAQMLYQIDYRRPHGAA